TLCFASLNLLPDLLTPEEFNKVVEALYRYSAYRLRLRIYSDTDIDALVRYWGKGGMEPKIRPLLESVTKLPRPEGTSISLASILPPLARLRLFTFPGAWKEPEVSREDC